MKMNNTELESLQSQLRKEIQSHQILVAKMKNDPQNAELQRQLHDRQAKITALSEKQKKVIQQLRKEYGVKDNAQVSRSENKAPRSTIIQMGQQIHVKSAVTVEKSKPDVPKLVSSPTQSSKISIMAARSPTARVQSAPLRVPQLNRVLSQSNRPPPLLSHNRRSTYHSSVERRPSTPDKGMYSRANPLVDMSKAENIVSKSHMKPGEGKKVEFMASLGLITPQTLAEIHSRRTERKRRSTANPQFSNYSQYEPDRKRHVGSYLSAHPTNEKKRRGRPPKFSDGSRPSSPEDEENSILHYNGNFKRSHMNDGHDDICAVCKQSGELLMCDTCSLVYHLGCLDPPLSFIPAGIWICPQCQQAGNDGQWPGTLAIVHSYIAHKAAREEEKKKLMKRQSELASERGQLETKAQQLKEKIMHEMKSKGELLDNSKKTQTSIDKLKNFLKIFQVVPS